MKLTQLVEEKLRHLQRSLKVRVLRIMYLINTNAVLLMLNFSHRLAGLHQSSLC